MKPLDVLFSRFEGKLDTRIFVTMLSWVLLNLISALFKKNILTDDDIKILDETAVNAQRSAIKYNH